MRLAYLCADRGISLAGTKGASIHVRSVATALARRGHEVTVFSACPEAPDAKAFDFVHVGFDRTLREVRRRIEDVGGAAVGKEVYALMLDQCAHEALVAAHGLAPFDAVYERFSLWSIAGLRFTTTEKIPFLLEVNAPLVDETLAYRSLELEGVARGIERAVICGADTVVVPSAEMRARLASGVGRDSAVRVIPNAVDEELFRDPPPLPTDTPGVGSLPAGGFVIAFVGSLKPWHGVDVLIEAFERLCPEVPDAHLLVLGDGPERPAVEALAARLPNRVSAPGAVAHERIPSWLARAHVGVAPYPALDDFYFSPLKLFEYQAAGLAVVASGIGQITRHVRHGRDGVLVPPGDPAALARSLEALAADPSRRERLGRRARRRALATSTWSAVAARIEAMVEEHTARVEATALKVVGGHG